MRLIVAGKSHMVRVARGTGGCQVTLGHPSVKKNMDARVKANCVGLIKCIMVGGIIKYNETSVYAYSG